MSSGFSSNSCRSLLNPFPSRERLRDYLRACLREACKFLALASFGGLPYSLDESGVVKCVLKAGCAVGTRVQIADKMSVDLAASPEPHSAVDARVIGGPCVSARSSVGPFCRLKLSAQLIRPT